MARSKFTAAQLEEIGKIQEKEGIPRKSAIRKYQRQLKVAKTVDVKKAAAHDLETPEVKPPAKNASLVAKGARYYQMAGKPSKDAVIACFGKTGYALSWIGRAERLGISTEELCERFRTNAAQVADQYQQPLVVIL